MKEILAEFLLSLEARGRAERTLEAYEERVGAVLSFLADPPALADPSAGAERGAQEIGAVQASDLDRFVVSQRRRGLSAVTIADHVQAIKAFFAWCVRRGYLASSPASDLVKPKLERGGRSPAMARVDLAALIRVAEQGKLRDLAVLLFLADTGCRVGEVVALTMDDLSLVDREAMVHGKTGGRVVDFTERTAAAVEAMGVSRNGASGSVFGMTANGVRLMLRRLGARAGVEGRVNPHSIRHLLGQAWLDDGANLELVRQKLGHSDIQVTAMFYAHQDRERVKAASGKYSLVRDGTGGK